MKGKRILCQYGGLDEETMRKYIREQEKSEQEQLDLEFDDEWGLPKPTRFAGRDSG